MALPRVGLDAWPISFLWLLLTNCHKLSVSKQHRFVISQFWRFYRGSRGESITSPFLASRGRLHSLAHGPFLHLQVHSGWSGLFPVMSP